VAFEAITPLSFRQLPLVLASQLYLQRNNIIYYHGVFKL